MLLLADAADAGEEQVARMKRRTDIDVLHVTQEREAMMVIAEKTVHLLVLGPRLSPEVVAHVIGAAASRCPGAFVLVIRARKEEVEAGWQHDGVGVLQSPLAADALDRSIDVLLAMR